MKSSSSATPFPPWNAQLYIPLLRVQFLPGLTNWLDNYKIWGKAQSSSLQALSGGQCRLQPLRKRIHNKASSLFSLAFSLQHFPNCGSGVGALAERGGPVQWGTQRLEFRSALIDGSVEQRKRKERARHFPRNALWVLGWILCWEHSVALGGLAEKRSWKANCWKDFRGLTLLPRGQSSGWAQTGVLNDWSGDSVTATERPCSRSKVHTIEGKSGPRTGSKVTYTCTGMIWFADHSTVCQSKVYSALSSGR